MVVDNEAKPGVTRWEDLPPHTQAHYAAARDHLSRGRTLVADHDFQPVAGHPDDDECTYRSDGTDATYCGRTKAWHSVACDDYDRPDWVEDQRLDRTLRERPHLTTD